MKTAFVTGGSGFVGRRLIPALRARGVVVRALPALPVTGDALRIGVGPWDAMTAVAKALRSEVGEEDKVEAIAWTNR